MSDQKKQSAEETPTKDQERRERNHIGSILVVGHPAYHTNNNHQTWTVQESFNL